MTKTKWQNPKTYFAVFYVSFIMLFHQYAQVAAADVAKAFPDVSPVLLSNVFTLPALISLPVQLIVGGLSMKVSKKALCIIGMTIFTVAGLLSWLVPGSFGFLLFTRALFGVGLGMVQPFPPALPVDFYWDTGMVPKYMGYQNFIQSAGGIIASYGVGVLVTAFGWRYAWSLSVFGILGIIAFCFLPNKKDWPAPPPPPPGAEGKPSKQLPGLVWLFAILTAIYMMCFIGLNQSLTFMLEETGVGSTAQAGAMFAFVNVIALICSFIYGAYEKITKKWAIAVGMLFMVIGVGLTLIAKSKGMFYVAMIFIGIAQGFFMPALFGIIGRLSGAASTFAAGILGVGFGLGMYMMSIVLLPLAQAIFGGGFGSPAMKVGEIVLVLVCIAFFIASKFINQEQLDAKGPGPGPGGPPPMDAPAE